MLRDPPKESFIDGKLLACWLFDLITSENVSLPNIEATGYENGVIVSMIYGQNPDITWDS